MRRLAALVPLLLGCAAASPRPPSRAASSLGEDEARALVRAFFDAVDRRDSDALRAHVAPGFVMFEEGNTSSLETLTGGWKKRAAAASRACTKEALRRERAFVIYIASCVERAAPNGAPSAGDDRGWNTVVLAPQGDGWKVALWQWQLGGPTLERAQYNDIYSREAGYFTREPNKLLVETASRERPGAALDLAMGQGRNALHLARQGWRVTGIDLSDEGVRVAKAAADKRGLSIEAVVGDIDAYDFGIDRWDLVTLIYAGNAAWIERLRPSVRTGGLVVVEYFRKDDENPTGDGFYPGELARLFAGWEILRDDVIEDVADWSTQRAWLVRFVARKR